ncbi:AAA family ATPase [Steroidobacter agaridevorans]|uniref:AAA family ATPase n=1 Tax=Steroidobacter agaridevorans TaxID=2695856 RepID=UPI00132C3A24|nr:AAA family ATPase [Steroidobacter agaridevorans]GFE85699.1 pilus assembly protein CpaE [Steroidobacter agaridevorans]
MTHPLNLLLVSRRKDMLDRLEQILVAADFNPSLQLNSNGHVDPLHGVDSLPDVVIVHLSHLWREELEAIAARSPDRRPALIVVGGANEMNVMRLAMQAGARDLIPDPLNPADLLQAIQRTQEERRRPAPVTAARISVFMNAKGGCGATMLACNVAHVLAAKSKRRAALLDLDLQFGAAPLYLDLYPKRGIAQALENLSHLDEVALDGYFAKHASGLNVLSHAADEPLAPGTISASAVSQLLEVTLRTHEHVVVDMPRCVDAVTTAVMQRANQIVIVLQQSVTAVRDATRLIQWLRSDVGVAKDQLCVVVNRHEKSSEIGVEDIQKTLACNAPALVPNDFKTVSECINSGTALLDYAGSASITRAVMTLETRLGGSSAQPRSSVIARTFSSLIPGRSR